MMLCFTVIDGEGYGPGASSMGRQQQVTAMDTSSGGGIMRGGIYHPNAVPNVNDPQVSYIFCLVLYFTDLQFC